MMITKDISKLQPDYFKKLYDLRLPDDWGVPYEEYIFRFEFVAVERTEQKPHTEVYYKDTPYNAERLKDYENWLGKSKFRMACLPDVIIKDGYVTKNRYGKNEEQKVFNHELLIEEYNRLKKERDSIDYEIACYQRLLKEPQPYTCIKDWDDSVVKFKKDKIYYGYQSLDNPPHIMMVDETGNERLIHIDSIKENFKEAEK